MFWAQGGGRRPGRRLTGADRTRVYSPAVSRVRVATPAAQSLERREGIASKLDPILAVYAPRPRKSDRRSTPPRDGTGPGCRAYSSKGACETPVTADE